MRNKNRWMKIPEWWFKTIHFINLNSVDLKMLLLLWRNTEDGRIPSNPHDAAFLAGYGQKQKTTRIEESLKTLHKHGFISRDVEGYFFAEFQEIMRQKSAKFQKKGAKIRKDFQQYQQPAGGPTRARSSSLSEKKEDDMKKPLLEGGVFHSQENPVEFENAALEIMKQVKNEK